MSVCVFCFFSSSSFPFSFADIMDVLDPFLISLRTEMPSALFFFFFFLSWPEGGVSGHVEHRGLV